MQITSMSHADCLTYITALQLCIIMRTRDPLCASLSSFMQVARRSSNNFTTLLLAGSAHTSRIYLLATSLSLLNSLHCKYFNCNQPDE